MPSYIPKKPSKAVGSKKIWRTIPSSCPEHCFLPSKSKEIKSVCSKRVETYSGLYLGRDFIIISKCADLSRRKLMEGYVIYNEILGDNLHLPLRCVLLLLAGRTSQQRVGDMAGSRPTRLSTRIAMGAICDQHLLVHYNSLNSGIRGSASCQQRRNDLRHLLHVAQSVSHGVHHWKHDQSYHSHNCAYSWLRKTCTSHWIVVLLYRFLSFEECENNL